MTITQEQIQAVGDQIVVWAESKFGTGPIATEVASHVKAYWDATGVAEVSKLLTDAGVTVTP